MTDLGGIEWKDPTVKNTIVVAGKHIWHRVNDDRWQSADGTRSRTSRDWMRLAFYIGEYDD